MRLFDELRFEEHVNHSHGFDTQACVFYPNGYGASVITGKAAYTRDSSPYELAVLAVVENDWDLCYSTDIADDVIGYLTAEEINELLEKIKALPVRASKTGAQ